MKIVVFEGWQLNIKIFQVFPDFKCIFQPIPAVSITQPGKSHKKPLQSFSM